MSKHFGKAVGFVTAMSDCFKRTGQTLTSFRDELSKLTSEDREWYTKHLTIYGYTIQAEEVTASDVRKAA